MTQLTPVSPGWHHHQLTIGQRVANWQRNRQCRSTVSTASAATIVQAAHTCGNRVLRGCPTYRDSITCIAFRQALSWSTESWPEATPSKLF